MITNTYYTYFLYFSSTIYMQKLIIHLIVKILYFLFINIKKYSLKTEVDLNKRLLLHNYIRK